MTDPVYTACKRRYEAGEFVNLWIDPADLNGNYWIRDTDDDWRYLRAFRSYNAAANHRSKCMDKAFAAVERQRKSR